MKLLLSASMLAFVLSLSLTDQASAGPLCSDTNVFPISITEFVSCTVVGQGAAGQDNLPNVQAALDAALTIDILLSGTGSFCPGPECSGSEFGGSDPANDFEIDPDDLDNIEFTFEDLPAGTRFITMKQANGFEIFKVPGDVPFTLTHQLNGDSTSHFSTFVPEPATALLLSAGLVGLGLTGRRRA